MLSNNAVLNSRDTEEERRKGHLKRGTQAMRVFEKKEKTEEGRGRNTEEGGCIEKGRKS